MARFLRSGLLNRALFSIEVIFHLIFPAFFPFFFPILDMFFKSFCNLLKVETSNCDYYKKLKKISRHASNKSHH